MCRLFISLNLRCGTSGSTLDTHTIIPEALKWTLKLAEKWWKNVIFWLHVVNLEPWLFRRWGFLRTRYFYKPILFIMTEVGKLWNWEMNGQSIEKNWKNRALFIHLSINFEISTSHRLTAYYSYRAFVNEKYALRVTPDTHMIIPEALKWTLKSAEKWRKKCHILTSCCQPWGVAISTLRLSPDEIFL